jgi:glycerol-3-phosphate acyltransferase PlsY
MDLVLPLLIYLFYIHGSFPTAFVVTYFYSRKDVTKIGSKNIGALNTYRATRNLALTLLVLTNDILKGVIPYIVLSTLYPQYVFLAFFGILGHNYPIFSKFKGGRGIAALLGLLLVVNPALFLMWCVVWAIGYLATRYIFVGAMSAIIVLLIFGILSKNWLLVVSSIIVLSKYKEKVELFFKGLEPKGL